MEKNFFILISVLIGLCGTSCSTGSIPLNSRITESPEAEVSISVIQAPVVAEIEVGQESVSSSDSWNLRSSSGALEERKQNLMTDMLEKYDADVILEPKVKVKRNIIGSTKLEMSGYPAKYKKFRNATSEDMEVMDKANDIRERQLYEMNQGSIEPGTVLGSGIPELPVQSWIVFASAGIVKNATNKEAFESNLRMAGSIGVEYLRRFNFQRCYYGSKLSLGVTGLGEVVPAGDESPSKSLSAAYVSFVPIQLGHSLYINNAMSVYMQVGFAVDWLHPVGGLGNRDKSEILKNNGFGYGAEFALGMQYYKFSIELTPRFIWNTPVRNATNTDFFNINFGYRF